MLNLNKVLCDIETDVKRYYEKPLGMGAQVTLFNIIMRAASLLSEVGSNPTIRQGAIDIRHTIERLTFDENK